MYLLRVIIENNCHRKGNSTRFTADLFKRLTMNICQGVAVVWADDGAT
jgi:hypothetical protein